MMAIKQIAKGYFLGLHCAWSCLRKILKLSEDEYNKTFGEIDFFALLKECEPEWVIEKFREFEKEKKGQKA